MSVPYALYAKTSGSSIPGPQGPAGNDGINGTNGTDGVDGAQGLPGNDGADGTNGTDGATGPAGSDATNYWTQSGANVYRSSGNVGIGIPSPSTLLDVNNGTLKVTNQTDGAVLFDLNTERNWQFRQLGSGAASSLELASVGGGGNKNFIINTVGSVGIGTTTPYNKLEVDGIGGLIIGYNYANITTSQSVTLTSTWKVIQTTASPTSVTFIAPSNGKVIIEAQFHLESTIDAFSGLADVSWTYVYVALGTSSTNGNHDTSTQRKIFENTHEDDAENHSDISTVVTTEWLLTGLSAGQSYTYYLNGNGNINNASCQIKWGECASCHPLILKVMTAP
jgi:hypothetical protein